MLYLWEVLAITPEITPLFTDDTALYCSAKSSTKLQQMLKENLASVAEWLNEHNLTLNEAKSKFLIIGSSQRLKSLEKTSLQICGEFLDKADCYKYFISYYKRNPNIEWLCWLHFNQSKSTTWHSQKDQTFITNTHQRTLHQINDLASLQL